MEELKDKVIVCKDCEAEFIFNAGEQDFYIKKGFVEPVRCKACRIAKKLKVEVKEGER